MKKNFRTSFIVALALCGIGACKKKFDSFAANPIFITDQAFLRVMHVSPNFRAIQNYPDSFNIYVGKDKINGTIFTYNSAFPAASMNVNTYASVPSGAQQIRLSLQGVNTIDSLTIISLQKVLGAGKYYTLFITDSLNSQQDSTKIWKNDVNFLPTDTSQYKIRFAHMILNDTAGKKVDVYSFRQGANIFSGISPGTITDYTAITAPSVFDTISIRRAGTTQELAKISNNVLYGKSRLYTILYRGTSGTAGTKPRGGLIYNNR